VSVEACPKPVVPSPVRQRTVTRKRPPNSANSPSGGGVSGSPSCAATKLFTASYAGFGEPSSRSRPKAPLPALSSAS